MQRGRVDNGPVTRLHSGVTAALSDYTIVVSAASVPLGPVVFVVTNHGNTRHSLREEGQGIDLRTPTLYIGDASVLDVPFEQPGEYTVYCDVGFHAGAGMITTLTVE